MNYRTAVGLGIGALLVVVIIVLFRYGPQAQQPVAELPLPQALPNTEAFATRVDEQGTVTVTVKPRDLSPNATSWGFTISLDTHTSELNLDLLAAAELRDDQGRAYPPDRWEGDPPGGHHREGTLIFAPLSPRPPFLTLIIRGLDGIAERSFTWNLEK